MTLKYHNFPALTIKFHGFPGREMSRFSTPRGNSDAVPTQKRYFPSARFWQTKLTLHILVAGTALNVLNKLALTPGGGSNTNTRDALSKFTGTYCHKDSIKFNWMVLKNVPFCFIPVWFISCLAKRTVVTLTLTHTLSRKTWGKRLEVNSFYMWLIYGALIHCNRGEGRYSLVSPADNLCTTVWHRLLCRGVWIVLLTTEGWRLEIFWRHFNWFWPLPTPFPTQSNEIKASQVYKINSIPLDWFPWS